MTPQINNDINSLDPQFRKKFDLRRKEVTAKYPNAVVFEARRSQERQDWLYEQGRTRPWKVVTRTRTSNHKDGKAVDIVFRNNGKLERAWPYNDLIAMAKKYWIRNLAPKELCHFEDDGTPLLPTATPTNEQYQIIKPLIDDWIRDGTEGNWMTNRIWLVIGKLYNKLKQ